MIDEGTECSFLSNWSLFYIHSWCRLITNGDKITSVKSFMFVFSLICTKTTCYTDYKTRSCSLLVLFKLWNFCWGLSLGLKLIGVTLYPFFLYFTKAQSCKTFPGLLSNLSQSPWPFSCFTCIKLYEGGLSPCIKREKEGSDFPRPLGVRSSYFHLIFPISIITSGPNKNYSIWELFFRLLMGKVQN